MSPKPANTDTLRRYILGETSEADSDAIEREYMAREESLSAVAEAEDDLIEDYLAGRCTPDERARFESHYLASPLHAHRVAVARALHARRSRGRSRSRFVPLALAASVLIGLVLGAQVLRSRVSSGRAAINRSSAISLSIPAVSVRGEGETPTVPLGDGSRPVELRLEQSGAELPSPPYEAVVRSVEGNEVWRGPAPYTPATAGALPAFVATIPPGTLAPGDYVVVVTGGSAAGEQLQRSYFRAVAP